MKIETEFREDHQALIKVEVDPEPVEEAKQRAARQLARKVKIPGFRPGKAPYGMVVRHLGEEAILEEAMDILVTDIYPKVIEESGIKPYGPGSLENIASLDPPKLEFLVPLKAEVELGDYRSIRIPYEYQPVSEEDVENTIKELRERQAVLEPVERPVQEGDMAYTRLSGKRIDAPEGEDPTLIRERPLPVIVEAETADTSTEWPFPGFSRYLIGMSPGEEKTVTHTFSEASQFESLRGVEAEFTFRIEEIKSRTLPELDDELAREVGDYDSLEEMRERIHTDLEANRKQTYHEEYDDNALEEVVSISKIKYPPQMLEREIDHLLEQLKNRLSQQNQDIDLYLKARNIDMDGLREELRPVAETRVKKSLVLLEISDAENIQVNPQEVEAETTRTMDVMKQVLSKADARRMSGRDAISNLVGNIMMDMLTQRTIERLRSIAKGEAETSAEAEGSDETDESTMSPAREVTAGESAELAEALGESENIYKSEAAPDHSLPVESQQVEESSNVNASEASTAEESTSEVSASVRRAVDEGVSEEEERETE